MCVHVVNHWYSFYNLTMLYVFVGSSQKVFHEPSSMCTRNYNVGEFNQACVPPQPQAPKQSPTKRVLIDVHRDCVG
jgi:hypothetical protein